MKFRLKNTKKAAMFGLDARIKKLCHTGLDPVSHALNNKHGAMFGLDARIALAIFGALSVISGAALYSAIQDSKVTAAVTELSELGKAYDAYYLDTGEELDVVFDDIYLEIAELITSSKKGWSGPYLSDTILAPYSYWLTSRKLIQELKDGAWAGGSEANMYDANCVDGTVTGLCYAWSVKSLGVNQESFAKAIDKKVDGVVNGAEGNLRYFVSNGGNYYILLKHRASFRY